MHGHRNLDHPALPSRCTLPTVTTGSQFVAGSEHTGLSSKFLPLLIRIRRDGRAAIVECGAGRCKVRSGNLRYVILPQCDACTCPHDNLGSDDLMCLDGMGWARRAPMGCVRCVVRCVLDDDSHRSGTSRIALAYRIIARTACPFRWFSLW
jgi:hypothetical protein